MIGIASSVDLDRVSDIYHDVLYGCASGVKNIRLATWDESSLNVAIRRALPYQSRVNFPYRRLKRRSIS